ncbi:hypothetical protein [Companilactobacillus kimchiensis]|uniref:DUF5776 domain-containing protein n=1 Tax=Companilactobacillus kimchiensis TaxID=993692 RepID=A0A0R2LCR8_9LACO|nr:hypothetical protein [Companilactobacillus kimchiensis]KRN99711.1 hypothetical protein IV57_GL002316 [Companilactobacillus kimchiensis]
MKKIKNLGAAIVILSLPLIALPSIISSNTVLAQTTAKNTKTHTYTGTGSIKTFKKTAYHTKDTDGNLYKALFMADSPNVKLTKKTTLNKYQTTWYATKKMTVKVGPKQTRTYYYVTSSDKKISGWTWQGYLYKGIFKAAD